MLDVTAVSKEHGATKDQLRKAMHRVSNLSNENRSIILKAPSLRSGSLHSPERHACSRNKFSCSRLLDGMSLPGRQNSRAISSVRFPWNRLVCGFSVLKPSALPWWCCVVTYPCACMFAMIVWLEVNGANILSYGVLYPPFWGSLDFSPSAGWFKYKQPLEKETGLFILWAWYIRGDWCLCSWECVDV